MIFEKEGMFEVTFKVITPDGTVAYTNEDEAYRAANIAVRKYGSGAMHLEKVVTTYLKMNEWYKKK